MAKKRGLFGKSVSDVGNMTDYVKSEKAKSSIVVLEELKNFIPPLKEDEREALKENIKEHGCRDKLLVWKKPDSEELILIDGHNRYGICQELDVDYNVELIDFNSIEDVKDFMLDLQLGRRNLSPEQMSYLRGVKYNNSKIGRGKYDRKKHIDQNDLNDTDAERTPQNVALEIAKAHNVSEPTVKRDGNFAKALDKIGNLVPEIKQEVIDGQSALTKTEIATLANSVHEGTTKEQISSLEAKILQSKVNGRKQPKKKPEDEVGRKIVEIKKDLKALENEPGRDLKLAKIDIILEKLHGLADVIGAKM